MWADNETSEDLLGFKVHAELIIEVIKDEGLLPVSIGVFGDWGSGKSSILKIIYEQLKGDGDELNEGTLVIYFNGWIFEGYDDAKAALLETIIKKFEENKKISTQIKEQTTKLLKSVNWMRVLGLGFKKIAIPAATAYFTGGLSLIPYLSGELQKISPKELVDKLQGDDGENFLHSLLKDKKDEVDETTLIREFRDDFKKMIDQSKIKKLVVIIDDLDRCTHERIIENLEAIKLFLNVEKTAFIIGADPRIVRHAIEHRYRTERIGATSDANDKNQRIITDYLEKLIQIPYNLPRLSDHEVETYMTLLFCKRQLTSSYPKVLESFREFRIKNRYGVFGFADIENHLSDQDKEALKSSITLIASLSSIIAEGLKGNPRQIKRFLNTFTLRHKLASIATIQDFKIDVLAKLMVLEYTYEDLFKELYTWQSIKEGEPDEIKELEEAAEKSQMASLDLKYSSQWKDEQVVRWLKAEPKLSGIDLRDYFWIARDKLFSSLSGSTLIPAHIKSLFKSLLNFGSASLLKDKITNEVLIENGANLSLLLSLFEKELIKTPNNSDLHKIFLQMMSQRVPNSLSTYKKVLKRIDHDAIPFSLRADFVFAIKENPELEDLKTQMDPKSQIYKALNQKR